MANIVYEIWYENQQGNYVWTTALVPEDMPPSEIHDRMMKDSEVVNVLSFLPDVDKEWTRDFTT